LGLRRSEQIILRIDGQAKLPFFDTGRRDLSVGQIIAGVFALLFIVQVLLEVFGCPGVGLCQPVRIDILYVLAFCCFGSARARPLTFSFCLLPLFELYACTLG